MNPTLMTIVVAVLGFVTVAGLGFAFAGGDQNQAKAAKRIQSVAGAGKEKGRARIAPAEQASQRRKQILESLKANEKQQRKTRMTVDSRLKQAGLSVSARNFWIFCGVLAVITAASTLLFGINPVACIGLGFGIGLGLPRWVLGVLIKRRHKGFTEDFPNAIDIIVRGIKSGLPVHDCLKVIARESPPPIDGEFQRLVEGLGLGMSLDQGLERMYDSMPTPEVRFFAIVMAIQQKTGGNLAEALSGLSSVLRARKLMREKIKAMSGEAVASAVIIGSLPPGIMALVSVTSPSYMAPMYGDPRGHMMLLGGAMWMAAGIFVMRRMINFKI
jgi:tight adherence protein B